MVHSLVIFSLLADQILGLNMKVLTYNIHKGFTATNLRFVLAQIKASIREANADILCLQEVLGEHNGHRQSVPGYPPSSQFEFLADEVWPHFAYGKNAVYSEGHHGNAVLSKYPIESWRNIDISTNLRERRGLLHVKICLPGGRFLHAFSCHLNLFGDARRRQVEQICEYLAQNTDRQDAVILAGDFNDWQRSLSPLLRRGAGLEDAFQRLKGYPAKTFPSALPMLTLDRIYYRNLTPRAAEVFEGKLWAKLSDHLALAAEFKF